MKYTTCHIILVVSYTLFTVTVFVNLFFPIIIMWRIRFTKLS